MPWTDDPQAQPLMGGNEWGTTLKSGGGSASGGYSYGPGATHLGGFNNPLTDSGYIEQLQKQRLQHLGAAQPTPELQQWEQNQANEFQGWAQGSQAMQQDAYNQAAKLAAGGMDTAGQVQLGASQGAQNAGVASMAHSAGGGARGAAAAAGNAQMLGQANAGGQANQVYQQSLADKAAGAQLMQQIADQQRGVQQGEYGFQAQQGADTAAYQQGWNGLNDANALWAQTMGTNTQMADLGYQNQAGALQLQQEINQMQQQTGIIGSEFSGAGGLFAHAGTGGGGNGGGSNGQPPDYTSDENAKEPFKSDHDAEDHFLGALAKSKSVYTYKDPSDEPTNEPTGGPYLGVMAQDLEHLPGLGHQLIKEDAQGRKMVAMAPMMSAMSAGLGRLHERLQKLENE